MCFIGDIVLIVENQAMSEAVGSKFCLHSVPRLFEDKLIFILLKMYKKWNFPSCYSTTTPFRSGWSPSLVNSKLGSFCSNIACSDWGYGCFCVNERLVAFSPKIITNYHSSQVWNCTIDSTTCACRELATKLLTDLIPIEQEGKPIDVFWMEFNSVS